MKFRAATARRWSVLTAFAVVLSLGLTQTAMAQQAPQYALGDIPLDPAVYQSLLKPSPLDTIDALPAAYDARDDSIVTPPKNQGACGSCWAFASVGAFESHLLKKYAVGPMDLSEQQQVSCNTSMGGCSGGSSSAPQFWETRGPVTEACYPYTASDSACVETCPELEYNVTGWHTVPQTSTGFKASLYDLGPSYWRYNVHQDFMDYWDSGSAGQVYVNSTYNPQGGHAVLLIGWDDSKGALLCKNSWGATGGPNGDGTFWIAYSGHANSLGFAMSNFDLEANDPVFALNNPANGATLMSAPTFDWSPGPYDIFYFWSFFNYTGIGYLPSPLAFWIPAAGFQMQAPWWDMLANDLPCFWVVVALNLSTLEVEVSEVRSFTKGTGDVMAGTWSLDYDWHCDGTDGTEVITINADGTWSGGGANGTWTLVGDQFTLYLTNGTTYTGTVNPGYTYLVGTMVDYLGITGCWEAVRISTADGQAPEEKPAADSGTEGSIAHAP